MSGKKKIIVAGAGHGGLVAAAKLAEADFSVCVYELQSQKQLGYDWTDCIPMSVVREAGLTEDPADSDFAQMKRMGYYISSSTTPLYQSEESAQRNTEIIERKVLLKALVKRARDCGATVKFGVRIDAPIIKDDRVVGIETNKGEFFADLIIDAAGVDSPLRSQLPEEFGIANSYEYGEVLYAYRGIFNKTEKYPETVVPYEVFVYHLGVQGLSWCITDEESVDMLIGCFEPMSEEYIEQQLQSFRIRRPQLGKTLLRGGTVNKIPTRRPLAQFVCNGYAAIGDSAFMTEPLTGSGIALSLKAGVILADAVLADEEQLFTAETLWRYNREYILNLSGSCVSMDLLKNTMLNMSPDELDFLLEKRVITEDDMVNAGATTTVGDMLSKVKRGFRQLPSIIKLGGAISKGDYAKKIYSLIPENYDKDSVEAWKEQVESTVTSVKSNNE